jgi:kynurenine formamidase
MRELSHPITSGIQVYPGDPVVSVESALSVEQDGVDVSLLHLGSHTGTHLDAPSHTVAGGRTTATISLDELVGEALLVHLSPQPARAIYGLDEITRALGELPPTVPAIVIMNTGWSQHFGSDEALNHPAIHPDAAAELMRRGMHLLAVDTLSPDPTGEGSTDFPVHEVVLGSDGLIIENITGLAGLREYLRVGFFPLPIDADGAPVRAVVLDD